MCDYFEVLQGQKRVKKGQNRLKLAKTVILSFIYIHRRSVLIKTFKKHQRISFETILLLRDHFKVPQRQKEGRNKVKLLSDITILNSNAILLMFEHIDEYKHQIKCQITAKFGSKIAKTEHYGKSY